MCLAYTRVLIQDKTYVRRSHVSTTFTPTYKTTCFKSLVYAKNLICQ